MENSHWTDCRVRMPPADHHLMLQVRFGLDPVPLVTSGYWLNKVREIYGPPTVAVFWRKLVKQ